MKLKEFMYPEQGVWDYIYTAGIITQSPPFSESYIEEIELAVANSIRVKMEEINEQVAREEAADAN